MRTLILTLILFLLVDVLATTSLAQKKTQPEKCLIENCLIKDGIGIENIVVGQSSMDDVIARFGKNFKLIDHNQYSYEASYEKVGLSFYYKYDDKQQEIFEIDITPPFKGVTETGVLLGKTTLAEVEQKYWPSFFTMNTASETWWFDYPGIQFHVAAGAPIRGAIADRELNIKKKVVQINIEIIDPLPPPLKLQATSVVVGKGPVLFFYDYEEVSGQRTYSNYLIDPESSPTPKLFLVADDDYKPWHRFDQDEFLMGSVLIASDLFYININNGIAQQLLPSALDELYKIDGGKVFFIEQEHSERGFAPNAEKVRSKRPQSRHTRFRLYVFDTALPLYSKLVTEEALLRVLAIDEEYCWVVVDRARPELWRITKDGKEQKRIAEIEDDWIFGLEGGAAAPDGSLFAMGVNDSEYMQRRNLIVLNVTTGKTIFRSEEINLMESGDRTFHPELQLVWLDNDRIRFSETSGGAGERYFQWVDLDVRTGKRLNEKRYSKIDYRHVKPSKETLEYIKPDGDERGLFITKGHDLFFKGQQEPFMSLVDESRVTAEYDVSHDGRWAAVRNTKTGMYLIDGKSLSVIKIGDWGWNIDWLPPVK